MYPVAGTAPKEKPRAAAAGVPPAPAALPGAVRVHVRNGDGRPNRAGWCKSSVNWRGSPRVGETQRGIFFFRPNVPIFLNPKLTLKSGFPRLLPPGVGGRVGLDPSLWVKAILSHPVAR